MNTLTTSMNHYEKLAIEALNTKNAEGFSKWSKWIAYHTVSIPFEIGKIVTIAVDVFIGLKAAPYALYNLGLNKNLYTGVSEQLKQGEWLIPTLVLLFARIVKPEMDFQTLSQDKKLRTTSKDIAKLFRNKALNSCKKLYASDNQLKSFIARPGFTVIYLLSAIIRVAQVTWGVFFVGKSVIYDRNEESFKEALITLNAGGIFNDLFKSIMRALHPKIIEKRKQNLNLNKSQEQITLYVIEAIIKTQSQATKLRTALKVIQCAIDKTKSISYLQSAIQDSLAAILPMIKEGKTELELQEFENLISVAQKIIYINHAS